jgi:Ca2+-binding RTX toxin-like protein
MQRHIEPLENRRLFAAAVVSHIYDLNNSLTDSLGGPALTSINGSLTSTGFNFNRGGGLSVSNAVTSTEYSIELKYKFASNSISSWRRVISFKNLTDDLGLYEHGVRVDFFNITGDSVATTALNTVKNLIITREASTNKVTIYLNGSQILTFTDTNANATFSSAGSVLQMFRDNTSNGTTGEEDPGFVDRIRIYKGVLTAAQVTSLQNGGDPPGMASIVAASGILTMTGGTGADTMSVVTSGTNLIAKVGATSKTVATSSVTQIQIAGNDGNDTISIASTVNKPSTITGGTGNDTITGGGGNDMIDGGTGADIMNGGGGIDTADYSSRSASVNVFIDGRANDGQATERDNVGLDIEIVLGGNGNDVLSGSEAANTLKGNGGSDDLFGNGGADSLDGGTGDDELSGGLGNDSLTGGTGSDQMYGDEGDDTFFARSSPADHDFLDGGIGNDKAQKDSLDSSTAIEIVLA